MASSVVDSIASHDMFAIVVVMSGCHPTNSGRMIVRVDTRATAPLLDSSGEGSVWTG